MPFLVDLTPTTILQDPTTIQGQALIWLAESIQHPQGFPMSLETDREYIRQRYAATVLDRATQEDGIPRVSVSGSDTCDWTGIQCVNGTITTINWANSDLVGYLPEEVAGFTDLITLDLGENQLTGPLPDGLFNCSKLEYLYLHENNLNGSLSERFADLPALIRIYLGNNQFTGNLPQGFGSPDPNSGNNVRPLRKSNNLHKLIFLSLVYDCTAHCSLCFAFDGRSRLFECSQQRFDWAYPSGMEFTILVLFGSLVQPSYGKSTD